MCSQLHRSAQSAPEVVIGENDVLRSQRDAPGQIVERRGAHVRRERKGQRAAHRRHSVLPTHGILEILQHALELAPPSDGRLDLPECIRVESEGHGWPERLAEGMYGGDFTLGLEHTALELDSLDA